MERIRILLLCVAVLAVVACAKTWKFETSNTAPIGNVAPADLSLGVAASARTARDAEILKVAIEGELLARGVFKSVVRSCDEADLCLSARVISPTDPDYADLIASLGGSPTTVLAQVSLDLEGGGPLQDFVLGGSNSGGLARPAVGSGAITIIGTEIARQVAAKFDTAE